MNNTVFSLSSQPELEAETILASVCKDVPIFTLRLRYPRPIHGEIMTHRVFGRNARSSRAVPVRTMLNEVRNSPYVPWHWGKNQRGMQADEECEEYLVNQNRYSDLQPTHVSREEAWLHARDVAADTAEAFMDAGYHKQNPNRLLEPFSWIDTLITATEWDNFLWLRQHEAAEPHLQDLANLVAFALDDANLQQLEPSEWHLPYITPEDMEYAEKEAMKVGRDPQEFLRQISAARCARISYKPFDGDSSYEREIQRYNMLVTSDRVHASPLEHQATPDERIRCPLTGQFEGWRYPHLHGNLTGYIQARKLIPNEVYTST